MGRDEDRRHEVFFYIFRVVLHIVIRLVGMPSGVSSREDNARGGERGILERKKIIDGFPSRSRASAFVVPWVAGFAADRDAGSSSQIAGSGWGDVISAGRGDNMIIRAAGEIPKPSAIFPASPSPNIKAVQLHRSLRILKIQVFLLFQAVLP